jgi:hypothetical protein
MDYRLTSMPTVLLERHPERPGSDSIDCQGGNWVLMLTVELGASSWPLSTEAAVASIPSKTALVAAVSKQKRGNIASLI